MLSIHGAPSFRNTPFRSPFLITEITLLLLHLDCSDPKQIHVKQSDFEMINDLLNTNICPENLTLVENSHIPEMDSHQIGLCPFELVLNYDGGRKPEIIVEAKCTKCLQKTCSTFATCKEITAPMNVTKDNKNATIRRSIGCFYTSNESVEIGTITPSYPRRKWRH